MQLNRRISREEYENRLKNIKLLLMDVDGVLTDSKLYLLPDGKGGIAETKGFDSQDGIGLRWLSWYGIKTGVISGRNSPATVERASQVSTLRLPRPHREDSNPGGNPSRRWDVRTGSCLRW